MMGSIRKEPIAYGYVTHPADLGPAIAALAPAARERMYKLLNGAQPTAQSIAEACDWWYEQVRQQESRA